MRAEIISRSSRSHSSAILSMMSRISVSGKSMSMNRLETIILRASFLLPERYRWYILSFGLFTWSAHQSAAALCHCLRDSVSARWMYHLLVSGLMERAPL